MRFITAVTAATTFALSAQAVVQTSVLSSGGLSIWKNAIGTGQETLLTPDASGALVASTTVQLSFSFNAVDNGTIVFPGSSEIVITKGRIGDYAGNDCLTCDAASGALAVKPCIANDAGAEAQLWQTTLVYHENDEATGSNREIVPYKKGTYTHLAGGKVYRECFVRLKLFFVLINVAEAASQPASKWFLTFSYIE